MFREPSVLRSDIRAHLEAENAYLEAMLGETKDLQAFLVGEMRSRIREDDASVPMSDGPWAYGTAFVAGGEHRRFIRVPAGGDEASVLLDGDREAEGKAYFQISDVNHSPNHTHLIWGPNDNGSEYYALRVRDLATGSDLDDIVERTHGASVWSLGYEGFFYTCLDENHRSSQVWNHRPGTPAAQDRLVHEETNPGVFISLGRTRDDA